MGEITLQKSRRGFREEDARGRSRPDSALILQLRVMKKMFRVSQLTWKEEQMLLFAGGAIPPNILFRGEEMALIVIPGL